MAAAEAADAWPKPLDVGHGRVCASFAFEEAWCGRPDGVRRSAVPPFG